MKIGKNRPVRSPISRINGAHSPGQYGMVDCFITEVVMTMMFLFIIMGVTHGKAPAGALRRWRSGWRW
jgi:glycerol uptake facilitator-like aquaporin